MRGIVTGTGRSGSLWVSRVLRTLGIHAEHERVWNYLEGREQGVWPDDLEVEVGWPAALHLNEADNAVHVVRNPVDVINSRIQTNWYLGDEAGHMLNYMNLYNVVDDNVGLRGLSHADQAAKHWLAWTRTLDDADVEWVQLEALSDPEVLKWLVNELGFVRSDKWIRFAAAAVPKTVNKHARARQVDWTWLWQNVSPDLFADLVDQAERYGYVPELHL